MSGSGRNGRSADRASEGSRQSLVRALAAMLPWNLAREIRAGQERLDPIEKRLDPVEKRLDRAELSGDRVEQRLDPVEKRLDALEETIGNQARRQDAVESTLRTLQDLLESINTVRLVGLEERLKAVAESAVQVNSRQDASESAMRTLQDLLESIDQIRLVGVDGRLDVLGESLGEVAGRLDVSESILEKIQDLLESISTVRLLAVDQRVDRVEAELAQAAGEVGRLRDGVMPAAEGRWQALFERLVFELEETASLVERMLASEPLPVAESDQSERDLADGLAKIQPLLVEAFRGSEAEIGERLENALPLFEGHAPVVDLGCGRGELLLLLREAGIEARGIESDGALVQGAIRRGLNVEHADVLDALRACEDGSVGAVTAFHLFEHFSGALLSEVLDQCRRVLRPEGILVAECPNPHNLRVGASLFWQDPTHIRPLLPETLSLFLKASGLNVCSLDYLHPFPEEQCLVLGDESTGDPAIDSRISHLEARLDELLHGPRDFRVVAAKK